MAADSCVCTACRCPFKYAVHDLRHCPIFLYGTHPRGRCFACGKPVILFYHEELGTSLIVKRIIGLPGETVEIRSGQVYIDETPLEELYVTNASSDNLDPVTIPAGHYFVLGDNRGHSHDARFWEDPFVSTEEIRAKAVFTLLPSVQTIE